MLKKIARVLGVFYLVAGSFGAGYFWRYYQDKAYPEVHILERPLALATGSDTPCTLPAGTYLYYDEPMLNLGSEYYYVYLSVEQPLARTVVDKPYLIAPLGTFFGDQWPIEKTAPAR